MSDSTFSTVLWDMDGTLIDQTAGIIRCFGDVITQMGCPAPDAMEIRRSMGGTMRSTMSLFILEDKLDDACNAFRAHFQKIMMEGLIILPGALECLQGLNAAGISQGILTNKHGPTARTVADHCGFSEYLSCCIGNTDTDWNKPDAALTQFALEQVGATTEKALYIGDSPTDVATAQNAGIACYGVSSGAHSVAELLDAGAEKAATSLKDLGLVE